MIHICWLPASLLCPWPVTSIVNIHELSSSSGFVTPVFIVPLVSSDTATITVLVTDFFCIWVRAEIIINRILTKISKPQTLNPYWQGSRVRVPYDSGSFVETFSTFRFRSDCDATVGAGWVTSCLNASWWLSVPITHMKSDQWRHVTKIFASKVYYPENPGATQAVSWNFFPKYW